MKNSKNSSFKSKLFLGSVMPYQSMLTYRPPLNDYTEQLIHTIRLLNIRHIYGTRLEPAGGINTVIGIFENHHHQYYPTM